MEPEPGRPERQKGSRHGTHTMIIWRQSLVASASTHLGGTIGIMSKYQLQIPIQLWQRGGGCSRCRATAPLSRVNACICRLLQACGALLARAKGGARGGAGATLWVSPEPAWFHHKHCRGALPSLQRTQHLYNTPPQASEKLVRILAFCITMASWVPSMLIAICLSDCSSTQGTGQPRRSAPGESWTTTIRSIKSSK